MSINEHTIIKNISLILPFRERIILLEEMIRSCLLTAEDISLVEMLIVIDDDEPCKREFYKIVSRMNERGLDISTYEVPRSEHFTKDYLNPLARKARGRWIIPINDDCDFPTQNWDTLIHKAMHDGARVVRDDIILGLTKDQIERRGENVKYPHFSCFPVVSKQMVDVLGFMWDERCYVWGPDHVIADVFRKLANTRRLVPLTHVTIGHKSAHTGRRSVHENYHRFQLIDEKYQVEIGLLDHKETLHKLREACKT